MPLFHQHILAALVQTALTLPVKAGLRFRGHLNWREIKKTKTLKNKVRMFLTRWYLYKMVGKKNQVAYLGQKVKKVSTLSVAIMCSGNAAFYRLEAPVVTTVKKKKRKKKNSNALLQQIWRTEQINHLKIKKKLERFIEEKAFCLTLQDRVSMFFIFPLTYFWEFQEDFKNEDWGLSWKQIRFPKSMPAPRVG